MTPMGKPAPIRDPMPEWRLTGIGLLRITFGAIWAIDAWFKWQPDFINNFTTYLTGAQQDQPAWVQSWIGFWINVVNVDPHVFAHLVAIGETAIAAGLIFGVLTNLVSFVGILLAIVIWTTAEGFGGPYVAGSADIGSAIIYVLVFVGLVLSQSGLYLGLDRRLTPMLGRFGFLASGPLPR
jgi:thiosulfate dehydrogenase [quinone] large subunit